MVFLVFFFDRAPFLFFDVSVSVFTPFSRDEKGVKTLTLTSKKLEKRMTLGGNVRKKSYLSTSPKTMSWVPIMVTTSASIWFFDIKSRPCKCAKPGALILQR